MTGVGALRRFAALLVLAALLATGRAAAQPRQWGLGTSPFSGGTLTAPLILDATQTACSSALALSWAGDLDTGLQRTAANTIALCIGGVAGLTLSASGSTYSLVPPSGGDLRLSGGASTGSLQLKSPDGEIDVLDSGDVVRSKLLPSASADRTFWRSESSGGGVLIQSATPYVRIGRVNAASSTTPSYCFADGMGTAGTSGTDLFCLFGDGAFGPALVQTVTIADDAAGTTPTDTTTPTSSAVHVTCNDANNCNYNPGESSLSSSTPWYLTIINVSAVRSVVINDTASVVEVTGGASKTLAVGESVSCNYTGTIWSCRRAARRRRRPHRAFRIIRRAA